MEQMIYLYLLFQHYIPSIIQNEIVLCHYILTIEFYNWTVERVSSNLYLLGTAQSNCLIFYTAIIVSHKNKSDKWIDECILHK